MKTMNVRDFLFLKDFQKYLFDSQLSFLLDIIDSSHLQVDYDHYPEETFHHHLILLQLTANHN